MTGFVMFYQFKSFDNEAIMLAASNKRAKLLNCFSNKMFQANPGLFFLKKNGPIPASFTIYFRLFNMLEF